jgi:hypothetical protein
MSLDQERGTETGVRRAPKYELNSGAENLHGNAHTKVYPKVSGLSHNEIYAYYNKHSLRSNTKGYGGETH